MAARISGRRERAGEFCDAVWPAVITPDESDRLRRKLGVRNRSSGRPPMRYLLTGELLRCGLCDTAMKDRPSTRGRRYVCPSDPGLGGCGRMSATADPLKAHVVDAVLYRLDTSEQGDLAGHADGQLTTEEEGRSADIAIPSAIVRE